MWLYEEDFECIIEADKNSHEFLSAYSDTLYDKHEIKTSLADERIEDEQCYFQLSPGGSPESQIPLRKNTQNDKKH